MVRVDSFLHRFKRTFVLGSDDYAIDIGATTHLTMSQDIELALRFQTSIKTGDNFFTDLNGFQVRRTKIWRVNQNNE